jgi:hypothetical protein
VPYLTRGSVCRLQLLLAIASAVILGSEYRGIHDNILFTVSNLRLPQPGVSGPHIYISQEQGGPVILPGTWFPFCCHLLLAGLWSRYLNPPPHGHHSLCNSLNDFNPYTLSIDPSARKVMARALRRPIYQLHLNYALLVT